MSLKMKEQVLDVCRDIKWNLLSDSDSDNQELLEAIYKIENIIKNELLGGEDDAIQKEV